MKLLDEETWHSIIHLWIINLLVLHRDANGHWNYVADPYSLQKHMLLRYWNDTDCRLAITKDMLSARYMPLIDHGEVNETENVCDTPPWRRHRRRWWVKGSEKNHNRWGSSFANEPTGSMRATNWMEQWSSKFKLNYDVFISHFLGPIQPLLLQIQYNTEPFSHDASYFNTPDPPKVFCGMDTMSNKRSADLEGSTSPIPVPADDSKTDSHTAI